MVRNSIQIFCIIAIVFFTVMLIMTTGCDHTCEVHRKPEAPKNLAPTLDSVIAVDSEYHGKEGKSEYGQYEPTDEYRMWIGNDGDTIWE